MEADTENKPKRGRPRTIARDTAELAKDTLFYEYESIRGAVNAIYVASVVTILQEPEKSFFVTPRGNIRRKGIAEQLGRAMESGVIAEADLLQWVQACIELYGEGYGVKEIESRLRKIRTTKQGSHDPTDQSET